MTQESVAADARLLREKKTKIQVIARAASVLRALELEPAGLSLGALAQRLKLPRSTVQRIVGALEAENLLIAASPTGRVKLGPALLRLASAAHSPVSAQAKPEMIEIARDLHENVNLWGLARDFVICLDQTTAQPHSESRSIIGDKQPLYTTAQGKAVLALLSDAELELKLASNAQARTPLTAEGINNVLSAVHEARRTGVAVDLEQYEPGMCAVAVGFRDAAGNRLALSIAMTRARFAELQTTAAERLLRLRDRLVAQPGTG